MKIICILFICLLTRSGFSQKLFNKIDKEDSDYIKSYLEGDIKKEDLFNEKTGDTADSSVTYTFSAIEWSAVKNCQPCLKEFVSKRKKLEEHMNVQDELDKCLAHAVRNDNMIMVDFLLKNKADINHLCESCHNQAPVQVSLTYNNYKMFFKLLKVGANINVENFKGQNLFHTLLVSYEDSKTHSGIPGVSASKSVDVAKIIIDTLLAKKVDINKKSVDNIPPLVYAAGTNQPDLYDYVKSKGGKFSNTDKKAQVALLNFAMFYKTGTSTLTTNKNMFEKVITEEKITLYKNLIETADVDGEFMLINSVKTDNEKAFKKIMELKPDVNAVNVEGYRAIVWAIVNGNANMCSVLLENNAEVDEKTIKYAKKMFKGNKELIKKFEAAPKAE